MSSHRHAVAIGGTIPRQERVEPSGQDGGISADESGNGSEGGNDIPTRAKRNSKKSHHDPYPNHLGFYSGTWYDVLVEAKNKYRLFIHTENPFPERNRDGLRDAHGCLLEIISKYKDDGIQLDEGSISNYH
jgi:hypothetical protein